MKEFKNTIITIWTVFAFIVIVSGILFDVGGVLSILSTSLHEMSTELHEILNY